MCDFQNVFDDMFPKSWLDPYGDMPLNRGHQVSVDIEVSKSDGVTKVTAVKTPPRSDTFSFQDALDMVLSITSCENGPLRASPQADDLGKRKSEKEPSEEQEKEKETKKDTEKEEEPDD